MRKINLVVIHCSASDNPNHDDWRVITKWHMERGWSDIGYHYVIHKDGGVHVGRAIHLTGAHAKGFNRGSIGICLTGLNEFSPQQFESLRKLCQNLKEVFDLERYDFVPHNALNTKKTCPNFNVAEII